MVPKGHLYRLIRAFALPIGLRVVRGGIDEAIPELKSIALP